MKVILLRDIARVGRKHEVKEISDGYVQNNLIPRGLVQLATPANLERIAVLQKKALEGRTHTEAVLRTLKSELAAQPLTIEMDANEQGHLFQAVRPADIAPLLNARGLSVDAKGVTIGAPIKEVGEHSFTVRVGDVDASFSIMVTKKK